MTYLSVKCAFIFFFFFYFFFFVRPGQSIKKAAAAAAVTSHNPSEADLQLVNRGGRGKKKEKARWRNVGQKLIMWSGKWGLYQDISQRLTQICLNTLAPPPPRDARAPCDRLGGCLFGYSHTFTPVNFTAFKKINPKVQNICTAPIKSPVRSCVWKIPPHPFYFGGVGQSRRPTLIFIEKMSSSRWSSDRTFLYGPKKVLLQHRIWIKQS